jgi:HlyD family secretion protein
MSVNLRSPKDAFLILCILAAGVVAGVVVQQHRQNPIADPPAPAQREPGRAAAAHVTALGRLRPGRGVIRVAGPSQLAVVVGKLLVEEGDQVQRGQPIALLDNHAAQQAVVDRLAANVESQIAQAAKIEAELRTGQVEFNRLENLHQQGAVSQSQLDVARLTADSAIADLQRTRAEITLARAQVREAQEQLELTTVRSPVAGKVLKIHTREGEKAGSDGIAEIADTGQMYAVAEVYETDLSAIHAGQRAMVTTALGGAPLSGIVERVGLKVGKNDVLGTDPVAKTDARVVEVEVRLNDSNAVANLTNMQVTVSIDTAGAQTANR